MKWIFITFDFLEKNIKEFMVDRGNFLIYSITTFLHQFTGIIFIWVIFDKVPNLVGWNFYEVLFIYGFFQMVTGVFYLLFAWTLWFPQSYIVNRKLDLILILPIPPYFGIFLQEGGKSIMEILSPLLGVVIMAISASQLDLVITPLSILKILIGIASGVLILGGIFTLLTSLSFWIRSKTSFVTLFMSFMDFGQYPITIYNALIKIILTWIIPLAFVAFYPSAAVLRPHQFGHHYAIAFPVGVFFFLAGLLVWNAGLKKYESAGT